ncbi:MAG: hypothetical protein QGI63_02200 [Rhodospirillales bacterium]|jgi:hypothetical protein|nr:hypothetical protein [Rhodospirillales bacterium]MDP6773058.1 hypothetical protein [Rhodospirillales bacterium]|tara:strand:- start:79 stop:462 length:384 start_codon:yes stop_codon:yes gene_type:complete
MRLLLIGLPVFAFFLITTSVAPASEDEPKGEDGAIYQIVKATTDRVWRLNKQTGEVAVCSLKGDSLVCTTSVQAAMPPTRTYEELEADKKRRRQERAARDKAFLDKVIDAMKAVFQAAAEREEAESQ